MIMIHPNTIQSIGIASIPRSGGADNRPIWLARTPVAAAVLTLQRDDDGRCTIVAETMSEVRSQEFPLCQLIEQALDPAAVTLIQPEDRNILRVAAAGRRFFAEPRLARLLTEPERMIDPCATWDEDRPSRRTLAKNLAIPLVENSLGSNQTLWERRLSAPLEERALGEAVTQMLLWSTLAAFENAEPGLFFEPALAICRWLDGRPESSALHGWQKSRPLMRAVSYEKDYRADLERRARGETRAWPQFRSGLFHT